MTFSELRKRLVFKAGAGYLALAWLLVQIIATLTPIYDLPFMLVRGVAFMMIMSYPLVVGMAWVYELTHNTRGWEKTDEEGARHTPSDRTYWRWVIGMLILALAILLTDLFVLRRPGGPSGPPLPNGQGTLDMETSAPVAQQDDAVLEKSIAVLPFTDLSENSDQEYFSDGLSQDLINRLAMMPDLQVAGRESSFYYKGRDEVLSVIGEALQVEHILLGSVRKSGNNLRVTAQLVSAGDGFNIWSRTYDRELADVFAIQSEIVDEVATALSVTLGAGEFDAPGMTHNIEAYDKTLQALAIYNQFTPDNVFRAINLLEEAVRIDPEYGRGWLSLGNIYNDSLLILSQDQAGDFPLQAARAFGQAALIAPDMPELMLVEADSLRNQGRFLESENLYKQYFEHYGYSTARAMQEYAQMLARTGQFNEARAMLNQARRQDPLNPSYTYRLALIEMYLGREQEVRALADYGLALEGGEFLFSAIDWELAMRAGDLNEAASLIRAYYSRNAEGAYDTTVSRRFMEKLASVLALNDFEQSTEDIIAMINDPSVTPLELRYVARLVAILGQPDIALDYWFGEEADPSIWDEVYADMRRLPHFNQLLQEKGMVDYWRATGDWGDFCVPAAGQDFVCN